MWFSASFSLWFEMASSQSSSPADATPGCLEIQPSDVSAEVGPASSESSAVTKKEKKYNTEYLNLSDTACRKV